LHSLPHLPHITHILFGLVWSVLAAVHGECSLDDCKHISEKGVQYAAQALRYSSVRIVW
jgi:hypothetical protein